MLCAELGKVDKLCECTQARIQADGKAPGTPKHLTAPKSGKGQQMVVVLPFPRLCWGPAAQSSRLSASPAHIHQAWFKAKNNIKCSEVSGQGTSD